MEIYSINIDGTKYKQYKTYTDALVDMDMLIKTNTNSTIKIFLEEFCDYGHLETCCKLDMLCEYKNLILKKFI
jgi:hypothetical protein